MKVILGTVSHATMRAEDLIPCFLDVLINLDTNKEYTELIAEGKEIINKENWKSDDTSDFLNEDLWEALNNFSPAYCYFGANEGDGSDYGYWPCDIEETLQDFEGLKVSDLSEVPDNYSGEVFLVNDHGNVTFYNAENGNVTEVWSIV